MRGGQAGVRDWLGLTIRLTEQERNAFGAQAAREGLSLEEWMKEAGRDRLAHPPRIHVSARPKSLLELFEPLRELEAELSLDPAPRKGIEGGGPGIGNARRVLEG